jgi:hypothetical protein
VLINFVKMTGIKLKGYEVAEDSACEKCMEKMRNDSFS